MFTEGQIQQLKTLLQPIEDRLTNLENGQRELKTDIEALRVGQSELRKDVDELKGNVQDLQQGQEELRASVKDLQQGQAEMKTEIKELQVSSKQIQNGQTAIKRRLTRIEKDINSLGKYFDSQIIHQRERVAHIENHLRLI